MDLRQFLESDTGVYYAVGVFTVVVFAVCLAVLAMFNPVDLDRRGLAGLTIGFLGYTVVYFLSISVYQIAEKEDV